MSGYSEFRKKMIEGYRNKTYIGTAIGELISIEPLVIRVMYGDEPFEFKKFRSIVNMDYLKKEDIGTQYALQFTSDNNTVLVLGEVKNYKDYYPPAEE